MKVYFIYKTNWTKITASRLSYQVYMVKNEYHDIIKNNSMKIMYFTSVNL